VNRSKIRKVEIENGDDLIDVTFYFEGSDEGFSSSEFSYGTLTRKHLDEIEYSIQDYNSEVELQNS
jgi:hypothetical protein